MQKDLYVSFADYEKAYEKMWHRDLFEILEDVGLDGNDL